MIIHDENDIQPRRNPGETIITIILTGIISFFVGSIIFSFLMSGYSYLSDFNWSTSGYLQLQPEIIKSFLKSTELGENIPFQNYHKFSEISAKFFLPYKAGLIFIIPGMIFGFIYSGPRPPVIFVSGTRSYEGKEAEKNAESDLPGGGVRIHPEVSISRRLERQGIAYIGRPGSGKTQALLQVIREVIDRGDRAIIHDNKGELTEAFGGRDDIGILAPWDRRTWRWDLSADIQGLSEIEAFAGQLTPPENEISDPMWSQAAETIITGSLMSVEQEHGRGGWNYQHLLNYFDQHPLDRLETISGSYKEAKDLLEYGGSPSGSNEKEGGKQSRTLESILINAESYMRPLRRLARGYAQVPVEKSFSIQDWIRGNSDAPRIIMLQSNRRLPQLSTVSAQSIFRVIAQLAASPQLPERDHGTWLIMDEFPKLGHINQIGEIWDTGRSKGIRGILAFQDYEQLTRVYDETFRDILDSNIGTKIIFECGGSQTPKKISQMIGEQQIKRYSTDSTDTGSGGRSVSHRWKEDKQPAIKPEYIRNRLGVTDSGVRGILNSASDAAYILEWPFVELESTGDRYQEAGWMDEPAGDPSADPEPESETEPREGQAPNNSGDPLFDSKNNDEKESENEKEEPEKKFQKFSKEEILMEDFNFDYEEISEEDFWKKVESLRAWYYDPQAEEKRKLVESRGIEGTVEDKILNAPVRHDFLEGKIDPDFLFISQEDATAVPAEAAEEFSGRNCWQAIYKIERMMG